MAVRPVVKTARRVGLAEAQRCCGTSVVVASRSGAIPDPRLRDVRAAAMRRLLQLPDCLTAARRGVRCSAGSYEHITCAEPLNALLRGRVHGGVLGGVQLGRLRSEP